MATGKLHVAFADEPQSPLASDDDLDPTGCRSASKVRVTFFESERPLTLPSPETSDAEWDDNMAESPPPQSASHQLQSNYVRQASTESGVDNPFRPDGDLSREADELLELLKGSGRPISEVLKSRESTTTAPPISALERSDQSDESKPTAASPLLNAANDEPDGRVNGTAAPVEGAAVSSLASPVKGSPSAGSVAADAVEIQHGVVAPVASESQVEHVVIKKKPKCHCCVIQ